jgi:hypothetical protein
MCNTLRGLNKKPQKRLQVQYYLKTVGFDMLVIFYLLRTRIIKLSIQKIIFLSSNASLWCDSFPANVCKQDPLKVKSEAALHNSVAQTQQHTFRQVDWKNYINIYNLFFNERLFMYKFSVFRSLLQRTSRPVFNWLRRGRQENTDSYYRRLFETSFS